MDLRCETWTLIRVYDRYGGQGGSQYSVTVVSLDVLRHIQQLPSFSLQRFSPDVFILHDAWISKENTTKVRSSHRLFTTPADVPVYITSINRLITWQDKSRKC